VWIAQGKKAFNESDLLDFLVIIFTHPLILIGERRNLVVCVCSCVFHTNQQDELWGALLVLSFLAHLKGQVCSDRHLMEHCW